MLPLLVVAVTVMYHNDNTALHNPVNPKRLKLPSSSFVFDWHGTKCIAAREEHISRAFDNKGIRITFRLERGKLVKIG